MRPISRDRPFRRLGVGTTLALGLIAARAGAAEPAHPFEANVKVTVTGDSLLVESDGIPTHPTGRFPSRDNPNRIEAQRYRFHIPLHPQKAERPVPTPFGPIGVALNGVPFYNPYDGGGRDAVLGPDAKVFDSCCGHPDPLGRYHYHKYPVCVKSPFHDPKDQHSPVIGFLFDGYALHGPNGADGTPPADLDPCNGHEDAERGYHYHVTEKFPYLIGAYRGVPDARSIDRPRFPGRNGPHEFGGPPPHPLMIALDADRDGALATDEMKGAVKALKALDRDGDGSVSRAELRPPRPEGPAPGGPPPPPEFEGPRGRGPRPDGPPPEGPPRRGSGGPPPRRPGGPPPHPLMTALDKNRDGALSAAEIKIAPKALKALDRDGDGTLSREELCPPRPNGPPPRDE